MGEVGQDGQRRGAGQRMAAPPLHPAFPEPQSGRAPQASLSLMRSLQMQSLNFCFFLTSANMRREYTAFNLMESSLQLEELNQK